MKLAFKTDVIEHFESQTGQRSLDHRMIKQKSATVNLTIEEFTQETLALALSGNHVTGSTGTVTDEPLPPTVVIGDRYFLAHPKVSNLVVKDSAGTPATLTLGTDYTAEVDFGAIQFLNLTGFTPPFNLKTAVRTQKKPFVLMYRSMNGFFFVHPWVRPETPFTLLYIRANGVSIRSTAVLRFKASYSYGAVNEIGIFTQPLPERYLRLEGLNTVQGNAKVLVELYGWKPCNSG